MNHIGATNKMVDTPRTDARVKQMIDNDQGPEGLEYWARDLERELNAVKQKDALPYFLCVMLGIIIGGIPGGCLGVNQMKYEAVREGHAEWVADASGMSQFKWKECK